MSIRQLLTQLANKSARSHVSRSSAIRARPQLETLETRMAPSAVTGDAIINPPPPPPPPPAQT